MYFNLHLSIRHLVLKEGEICRGLFISITLVPSITAITLGKKLGLY